MEPKNKIKVKEGNRFGRLRIVGEVEPYIRANGKRFRQFLCYCDCGWWTYALLRKLREGRKKSCGCMEGTGGRPKSEIKKERVKKKKARRKRHEQQGKRPHRIQAGIKQRIKNPKSPSYKWYGGRGLTMDKKWETLAGFWEDMEEGYRDDLVIDRIDNEQGYYKWNCRWTTIKVNNRNSRNTIKYKGKCMKEWAEAFKVNRKTMWRRKKKLGSLREAVKHYQRRDGGGA